MAIGQLQPIWETLPGFYILISLHLFEPHSQVLIFVDTPDPQLCSNCLEADGKVQSHLSVWAQALTISSALPTLDGEKFQSVDFYMSCINHDCLLAGHIIIIILSISIQADWGHFSVCGPPSLAPRRAGCTHPRLPPRDLHFANFPLSLSCINLQFLGCINDGGSVARERTTGIFRAAESPHSALRGSLFPVTTF